jgi:hypothetical protein
MPSVDLSKMSILSLAMQQNLVAAERVMLFTCNFISSLDSGLKVIKRHKEDNETSTALASVLNYILRSKFHRNA